MEKIKVDNWEIESGEVILFFNGKEVDRLDVDGLVEAWLEDFKEDYEVV